MKKYCILAFALVTIPIYAQVSLSFSDVLLSNESNELFGETSIVLENNQDNLLLGFQIEFELPDNIYITEATMSYDSQNPDVKILFGEHMDGKWVIFGYNIENLSILPKGTYELCKLSFCADGLSEDYYDVITSLITFTTLEDGEIGSITLPNQSFRIMEQGNYSNVCLSREISKIHVKYYNYYYNSQNDIFDDNNVSFRSENEKLSLLDYSCLGNTVDFYFSLPQKGGKYTLKIESNELYEEDYIFEDNELYVVAQSPLTGIRGMDGYTDVIFNDYKSGIPLSYLSLISPTGKNATISLVNYIDTISPARHRIIYEPLEEDGVYTLKISKGLTSGSKKMLYDFESTIETPCANLKPQHIVADNTTWKPGQQQTIKYTISNIGSKSVEGECEDVIYLSKNNEINSDAVEIYRGKSHIKMESQESVTISANVIAPTLVEGDYYLTLAINVVHKINELSYNDNVIASDKVQMKVDFLSDENRKFTLKRDESRLFRIPVEAQKNIEISDKNGIVDMFIDYGSFLDKNAEPHNGKVVIHGGSQPMICYLLVKNNNRNSSKSQYCELDTRQFDIEIASIGRETVVKHKMVWIPIEVIGCSGMPKFSLIGSQGQRVNNIDVRVKSETSFLVKFDTRDIEPGIYNLLVESGNMSGFKQNGIMIVEDPAKPSLRVNLFLPDEYRVGNTFVARISYENNGNVDIPIPLLVLSGEEGSMYRLEESSMVYSNEIHLVGLNAENAVGCLLPGESGTFNVTIDRNSTSTSTANYNLKAITEGCEGINNSFYLQWLDVEPDEKPLCYTDEEWSSYCSRLRGNVGDTWMTFVQALGDVVEMYYSNDHFDYDAHLLYNILKEIDLHAVSANNYSSPRETREALQDVESGTLFIWKNGKWNQLVDAVYSNIGIGSLSVHLFKEWTLTDNISLVDFSALKNFIISHGWNDDREGDTKMLAEKLSETEGNCNIFGVDWSSDACSGKGPASLGANFPAMKIPNVAEKVVDGLCTIFGVDKHNLRINNLHLIGHSHGAHVCGMIAHYLPFRPKRLTALDASQELSHYYSANNFLGTGWSNYDVLFLDYYKSSIMAGTNLFKGDNNFILIESDDGFTFDKWYSGKTEEERHRYSIIWFSNSITNKTLKIGYNLTSNYLKDNWWRGFNESQYHGVINGGGEECTKNILENFDIRNNGFSPKPWRYTNPWYGKKTYQFLFNDNIFQNAFARTIEYEPISIDPYLDGKDHIKAGTRDHIKVRLKNNADNHTVPLNLREREVRSKVANAIFIANNKKSIIINPAIRNDGISEIRTSAPIYLLGVDDTYGNIDGSITELDIDFTIPLWLWNELAANEKDNDYIECDLWFVPGCDNLDLLASLFCPTTNIRLWEGELYPENNVLKKEKVKIKNPTISCNAGEDKLIMLKQGETTRNVSVYGTVERDGGYDLSYSWEYKNNVFSNSDNGRLSLGVGKHRLTFRIKTNNTGSSVKEASDDLIITVKPFIPGDEENKEITPLQSYDPNEKVGFNGVGVNSSVMQGEKMVYSIYFENDAEKAQLAAQKVVITDTLDTAFDLSTFEFLGTEVANTEIIIPSGKNEITAYTDLRPYNDLILKTEMKLDIDSRVVTVTYTSLDTLTMEPTMDMFAGFLPPNDSTHVGEGHFSYRVKLRDDVADSYEVRNTAHIVFDYNDVISTNTTCHVLDNRIPVSWMDALPAMTEEDSVLVSWSGRDDGSGIRYYDIYRSKNDGPYEMWLRHTPDDSVILHGEVGDKYKFYSIATDYIGFVENDKTEPEATIMFVQGAGVEELTLSGNNVDIYPKVIEDNVNISVKSLNMLGRVSVNIYDLSGKRHLTSGITTDGKSLKRTIDCNSLAQGIYIIEVLVNNTKWSSEKVIKK